MSPFKSVFLAVSILIYGVLGYLFLWRIFFINQKIFLGMETRLAYRDIFSYIPSIVFLLYGALLLGNIMFRQTRLMIFNSFFASALILTFDATSAVITGTLAGLFGLVIATFECRKMI